MHMSNTACDVPDFEGLSYRGCAVDAVRSALASLSRWFSSASRAALVSALQPRKSAVA